MSRKLKKSNRVVERFEVTPNERGFWRTKNGKVAMRYMSDEHLQNALLHSQRKILEHHNATMTFERVAEDLKAEGERRGIRLADLDEVNPRIGDFFALTREMKEGES